MWDLRLCIGHVVCRARCHSPSLFAQAVDDLTRVISKMKPFSEQAGGVAATHQSLLQEAQECIFVCEGRKFEALLVMSWKSTQSKPEGRLDAVMSRLSKFNATKTPHKFVHAGMWKAAQSFGTPAVPSSSAKKSNPSTAQAV